MGAVDRLGMSRLDSPQVNPGRADPTGAARSLGDYMPRPSFIFSVARGWGLFEQEGVPSLRSRVWE